MGIIVDSHTHTWSESCRLTESRRYTPPKVHRMESLFQQAQAVGIGRIVLVQPSFLGTDNSYLLQQLQSHPETLRGVVVVEPNIAETDFKNMVEKGVVGVRLNIIGTSISAEELLIQHRHVIDLIKKYDCHLEIQTQGEHWVELLPALLKEEITLVVDHFGRPNTGECSGFASILNSLASGRVWVKLSGEYRFQADPIPLAKQLIDIAPERLIWGSDFPWTQHEENRSYQSCLQQFTKYCQQKNLSQILEKNPQKLFKF